MATLVAWLQFLRIAGVVTLLSNACASCAMATYAEGAGFELLLRKLWHNGNQALLIALVSVLLYAAGMAWNDVCDAERDRHLHPRRPIPSGRIGLGAAVLLAILLAVASLLVALECGYRAFFMAGIVLTLTFLYNTTTKHVAWLGALTMGAIRCTHAVFVLLMLGNDTFDRIVLTAVAAEVDGRLSGLLPLYPLLLTAYIVATTLISELETRSGSRFDLLVAAVLLGGTVPIFLARLFTAPWLIGCLENQEFVLAVLGVLAALGLLSLLIYRIARPLAYLIQQLEQRLVGPLTGRLLGSLILFDATLVACVQPLYTPLVLLLLVFFWPISLIARME